MWRLEVFLMALLDGIVTELKAVIEGSVFVVQVFVCEVLFVEFEELRVLI